MKRLATIILKQIWQGRVLLKARSMRPGASPFRNPRGKKTNTRHDVLARSLRMQGA